nr:unnamed protein product [Digitaria exilis]
MQAVRPAAEAEEEAAAAQQEQVVREEAAAEVKREVGKEASHQEEEEEEEEEAAPEEKDVAVVGEEAEAEGEAGASAKKNRIQVSTNKKPLYFYVNLAKNYDEVELSALGMEILTSTIGTKDESKGRLVRKAKIEILLCKSENFNSIMSSKKSDRPKSSEDEIKV